MPERLPQRGPAEGPVEEEAQPMVEPQGERGLANRPGPGEPPGPAWSRALTSRARMRVRILMTGRTTTITLEEEQLSGAGHRVSAALEAANKMFLRTSRAREAALDGGFQMHYEKTPFDQLAFIEELFSLMVVNRLTEELGCDEIIDRE